MNSKKWVATDTPIAKPQNFPWGTLGLLVIITFSCLMIAGITFFIYSGKYERNLIKLKRAIQENQQLLSDLEKIQTQNLGLLTQNEKTEVLLKECRGTFVAVTLQMDNEEEADDKDTTKDPPFVSPIGGSPIPLGSGDPSAIGGGNLMPMPNDIKNNEIIFLSLSNKHVSEQNYSDHVWFDVSFIPTNLFRPTRAVKGSFVFADLFGEVKFLLGYTIDDPLKPGVPFKEVGIGFDYNQFMEDHQWVYMTDLNDMRIWFRVDSIIYEDGERKDFH